MINILCCYIRYISIIFIFICNISCAVELRTSNTQLTKDEFYVAIDFKVPNGSHVTAPIGVGKTMSPSIKLTNCKILDTVWAKASPILNRDGSVSKYMGFYKDFTVLLKVLADDVKQPITYDIFYVQCNKSCTPKQFKGTLHYNGKLPISNIASPQIKKSEQSNNELQQIIENKNSSAKISKQNQRQGTLYCILMGLLGGLVLNIMPCVFPVISIKLLSIAKSAGQLPKLIRHQCISYSLGTIFMFLSLGLIVCIARLKVPSIGWGFYMQNARFNLTLLILFLLCALHFFGIYQFHFSLPQISWVRNLKSNVVKSFVNGIFGTITSTVCVGPFLGLPISNALLSGSITEAIVLFIAIGTGLALPFIFIALFPQYIARFPKLSETALKTFSVVLGTLMLLSCAWIISILIPQLLEPIRIACVIMVMIIVSVFLYVKQNIILSKNVNIIFNILILTLIGFEYTSVDTSYDKCNSIVWHDYTGKLPKERPLFVNFTAAWCLNCQFNSVMFKTPTVKKLFNDNNIYAIKCDWTNRDSNISDLLSQFGSVSVPFYVYYPKTGEYIVLPPLLTHSDLVTTIKSADRRGTDEKSLFSKKK